MALNNVMEETVAARNHAVSGYIVDTLQASHVTCAVLHNYRSDWSVQFGNDLDQMGCKQ